jgi:hypothetical protein
VFCKCSCCNCFKVVVRLSIVQCFFFICIILFILQVILKLLLLTCQSMFVFFLLVHLYDLSCMYVLKLLLLTCQCFFFFSSCSYLLNNIIFAHGCYVFWHRCFMVLLLFNFVVVQVIHLLLLGLSTARVPHLKHKNSLL